MLLHCGSVRKLTEIILFDGDKIKYRNWISLCQNQNVKVAKFIKDILMRMPKRYDVYTLHPVAICIHFI